MSESGVKDAEIAEATQETQKKPIEMKTKDCLCFASSFCDFCVTSAASASLRPDLRPCPRLLTPMRYWKDGVFPDWRRWRRYGNPGLAVGKRLAGRLAPSVRPRLVDAADGPAAGALTLIRQLVAQEELHPA